MSSKENLMDYCPDCGAEIIEKANFCQECGRKFEYLPLEKKEEKKQGLWTRYKNKVQESLLNEEMLEYQRSSKYDKTLFHLENSVKCTVKLPDYEIRGHSGKTKAIATLAGGIPGFALASGSKRKRRKIKSSMRMAEKGIIIQNGEINGADLRIPWDNIVNIDGKINQLSLALSDGGKIDINLDYKFSNSIGSRNPAKYVVQIIQPKCQGTVIEDEGW